MLVRKNYYLYAENAEKQNKKKKLLGSVRLTPVSYTHLDVYKRQHLRTLH